MARIVRYRPAKFPATCWICHGKIREGQQIAYRFDRPRGQKCACASCYNPDVHESGDYAPRPAPPPPPASQPFQPSARNAVERHLAADAAILGLMRALCGPFPDVDVPAPATQPAPSGPVRHRCYDRLAHWVAGGITRIWITGPAGTGKTFACEQICKDLQLSYHVVTPVETRYDLLGYNDAQGRYVETPVYRWAVDPDPRAVLILDEVDGFQPGAMISINAVLANGMGVFPHAQMPIAETKIVIGTANTMGDGPDVRYSGRLAQDAAVLDRFAATLEWPVDEAVECVIARTKNPGRDVSKAIQASQAIRREITSRKLDLDWGPRRTYAVCALTGAGESLRDAVMAAGLIRLREASTILSGAGVR